jgi:hypothetical protein
MRTSRVLVYIAILAMYIITTAFAAIAWVVVKSAFITNGQTPEDTMLYLVSNPWVELPAIALPANVLLADCILVGFPGAVADSHAILDDLFLTLRSGGVGPCGTERSRW